MGCKPSKESQVAKGNTVHTTPNFQKKKSNASNLKIEENSSTVTPSPTDKANDVTTTNDANVTTVEDEDDKEEKKEEKVREEKEFGRERVKEIRNVCVMDVQENNNEEEDSEERRNVVAPDSPDLFFSTRKEEVPVEILTVPLVEKSEADNMPENNVLVKKFKVDDQEMKEEKEVIRLWIHAIPPQTTGYVYLLYPPQSVPTPISNEYVEENEEDDIETEDMKGGNSVNGVKDMKNGKDNDDIEEKKEEVKEKKELRRETIEEIKNTSVKDVQENNNDKEETKERRNVIAPDSPDQFFSTRKDEVPVEILTLPLAETLEADDVPENNVLVEEVKVEDQDIKEEKEGEPNCSQESADPKETILVKEEGQ